MSFTVWGQEIIFMQMRCKLPNEFPIRRPRLSSPGSACEFYEWACVGDGVASSLARPYISLRCACDMPSRTLLPPGWPRPGLPPAGQLLRMGLGKLPAISGDASGGQHSPWSLFLPVFGMGTDTGGSEVSLQALSP